MIFFDLPHPVALYCVAKGFVKNASSSYTGDFSLDWITNMGDEDLINLFQMNVSLKDCAYLSENDVLTHKMLILDRVKHLEIIASQAFENNYRPFIKKFGSLDIKNMPPNYWQITFGVKGHTDYESMLVNFPKLVSKNNFLKLKYPHNEFITEPQTISGHKENVLPANTRRIQTNGAVYTKRKQDAGCICPSGRRPIGNVAGGSQPGETYSFAVSS